MTPDEATVTFITGMCLLLGLIGAVLIWFDYRRRV